MVFDPVEENKSGEHTVKKIGLCLSYVETKLEELYTYLLFSERSVCIATDRGMGTEDVRDAFKLAANTPAATDNQK